MHEVTVRRTFTQPPDLVWPSLADLACWIEPGVRWRVDEAASKSGELLVARVWEGPGSSSLVTLKLESTERGGSLLTVVQQRDRHFEITATSSSRAMVVS